jgi:phage regulator Rha-like protein
MQAKTPTLLPVEHITRSILVLRGHKVLLDAELAVLYEVTTKRFNEQVRRNRKRFPEDFMFQLTAEEVAALRSQIATSNAPAAQELRTLRSQIATLKGGRGQHRKYLPYAFTEHGAIMAATVLNSSRAVEMSVYVVRAFVKLREVLASNKELAQKLDQLERKLQTHDQAIVGIFNTIRKLMAPPAPPPPPPPKGRPIGFTADFEE